MSSPLNQQTASQLAAQLSRREISAEKIVQACLERIASRESEVQAWSHLAKDAALNRARELIVVQ